MKKLLYVIGKTCIGGYTEHRDTCIKLMSTPAPYSTAKSTCVSEGGSLLKINYEQELSEIVKTLGGGLI